MQPLQGRGDSQGQEAAGHPQAPMVPPPQHGLWPTHSPSICHLTHLCPSTLTLHTLSLWRKANPAAWETRTPGAQGDGRQGLVGAPGPMSPSLAPRPALGLGAVPLPSMQTIPGNWVIPSQNCIPSCMPLFICYSKHVSFEFFIQSILASAACLGKQSRRSRLKHISLDAKRVVLF